MYESWLLQAVAYVEYNLVAPDLVTQPDMIIFPKLLVDQKREQGQFADDTPMVIEVSPWEFLMPAMSHMGSTST